MALHTWEHDGRLESTTGEDDVRVQVWPDVDVTVLAVLSRKSEYIIGLNTLVNNSIMMQLFHRISIDQKVMGGRACIRDTRIPVSLIMNLLSNGKTFESIQDDYPELSEEDLYAALKYAEWSTSETVEMVEP